MSLSGRCLARAVSRSVAAAAPLQTVASVASIGARRSFGAFHVPVGPQSNIDGVYRRPQLGPANAPLSEHDELMWDDAQAPEPTFDQFDETNRWEALGKLVGALAFVFIGVHGAVRLYGPEARQVVVPQEYPFDGLRLSQGGPGGAPVKRQ